MTLESERACSPQQCHSFRQHLAVGAAVAGWRADLLPIYNGVHVLPLAYLRAAERA